MMIYNQSVFSPPSEAAKAEFRIECAAYLEAAIGEYALSRY